METVLSSLKIGECGVIRRLENHSGIRRRLLDLGLAPGEVVEVVFESPLGDPVAYRVLNSLVAIRNEDAKEIIVEVVR